ncbi:S8 family serine peptidase [Pseudobdellovibrio exovorus]|uniref:Peptidase S8/S53 domain-containing protein n=1 Tax=Pseudobdellovibrio exovorus JSS TaxID=1184267 RepID=M4VQT8_9BACT|nr:S8 family serine peptidase [Pseudobdellovibrio exovorus]AGH95509.1 hypothetical protein A11Q_1293 [Pseudobdellovibrio exovorus JSS]
MKVKWKRQAESNRYSLLGAAVFSIILLLQFNNCGGQLNSQFQESLQGNSSLAANTQLNTPVNPSNPYYLQCISSSDAAKINSSLSQSVKMNGLAVDSKITSLDWQQDEDLIVTLDNSCVVEKDFSDPILSYIDSQDIQTQRPYTVYTIKKEKVKNLKLFIAQALDSECLLSAEKDGLVQIKNVQDPQFSSQRHLSYIGASESFLDTLMSYNSGQLYPVKVAIIDTGIDTTNTDLQSQFARNSSGQIIGHNSTESSNDFLSDSGYHGTHVAGLIGATYKNGLNGSGVYGRNIKIYPVRGSNNGDTFRIADLANAIIWAADQGVDIINLSLGTPTEYSSIKNAISYGISKNIIFVVAAGNEGKLLGSANPQYPAMYSTQFSGLVTVSSIDASTGGLSSFSSYSSTYVDILAPGSNGSTGIASTIPITASNSAGFASRVKYEDGSTGPIQGTSMAAPLVTGVLAAGISMAKSQGITLTNTELKTLLKASAAKSPSYTNFSSSGNSLNLPSFYNHIRNKIYTLSNTTPPPTTSTNYLNITQQPVDRQLLIGENIELNIEATSNNTISYQWYRNNQLILGATSKNYKISGANENSSGAYHVIASTSSDSVKSQTIAVKVALRYCN